jgi:hypothetical protein
MSTGLSRVHGIQKAMQQLTVETQPEVKSKSYSRGDAEVAEKTESKTGTMARNQNNTY